MNPDVETLMIDSGAFTVWTRGEEVDLEKYIEFCKEFEKEIDVIVALDVMPGKNGSKVGVTKKEVEYSCQKGWDNYMQMLDAGLPKDKVVPVFHQMDDFKWLEKLMEYETPYFGLSPTSTAKTIVRQMWLDDCMNHVCDKNGMPLVKLHGFAVTSIPLVVRYPWWSCDSTAYLMSAAYGYVLVPHKETDGSWNYLRTPMIIHFSTQSQREGSFDLRPPLEQDVLREYLYEEVGTVLGKSEYKKRTPRL